MGVFLMYYVIYQLYIIDTSMICLWYELLLYRIYLIHIGACLSHTL